MVLAGLSQSEKQFAALMKFVEGLSLVTSHEDAPVLNEASEEDIEDIMSGAFAERTARLAPTEQVAGLLGHGFLG